MAKNFGELALVLGDAHVPHRAGFIPEKFQRMLAGGGVRGKDWFNALLSDARRGDTCTHTKSS